MIAETNVRYDMKNIFLPSAHYHLNSIFRNSFYIFQVTIVDSSSTLLLLFRAF